MYVEITSAENILLLHYFDTPKLQDGKPGFEMTMASF
jgi:hypothetical protein